jgi:hypothetical protein
MDICSVCKAEFATTEEYLEHICTTGFKPKEFEHQVALDPNYEAISKSALERGSKGS